MQATARGEKASEATSDEACETADGGDADAATVDEPLEETAGLEDVDGAAERANEAACDKPTKRRPELEGGERVAVAAVLTDERVEGGVDELVAELADDRRHDQIVHLQLLVVVLCGQWGDSIARFGWSCWTIWLFTLFIATREREEEESPMLFSGINCSTRPAT